MSSDCATAWDALTDASVDQRLKVAEVAALLAIAQEMSAMNPRNHIDPA